MPSPDVVLGIAGAGTMGAGIARLAEQAGFEVRLWDPVEGLGTVDRLEDLIGCGLVIEAAPERLQVKRELFAVLGEVVGPKAVLATNTSSLPITSIASAAARPERVVGMHFFNPPEKMRLLEVVAGAESSPEALALAREVGQALGKEVIDAKDGPGFLVNRCNRPFGLEALRLVQEGISTPEEVDRIVRLGGGFRMGPFELMDLVGIDVGFEVSRSFWELSFGEPRWRPSPLAARMVAAGRLGRKTGRGWYEYREGERHRPQDPSAPPAGGGDGRLVVVAGDSEVAEELVSDSLAAGWSVASPEDGKGEVPFLIVDCGADPEGPPLQGGPQVVLCAEASVGALGASLGFHALPGSPLVELCSVEASASSRAAAEEFFSSLGRHVAGSGDAPGLVLGRIVAQAVNEACFALGEGVGSAADIDLGMRLGLNWPRGPLEWGDAIGLDHVLAILDGLWEEYREERYRVAPELRRRALAGRGLREE